jgi:hypothetical protein
MSARTAAWLAWSVWGFTLALLVVALLSPKTEENGLVFLLPLATGVIAWSTVGAVVASRRPENPVGWILWAMGLLSGVALFAGQYATYALLVHPGSLPGGELVGLVSSWIWVPVIGLLIFLLLLFPNGRLPTRRWRPVAWTGAAVIAMGAINEALVPGTIDGLEPFRNPLGIEGAKRILTLLATLSQVLAAALLLIAAASLFVRLLRARGEERQQVKWLAYAAMVLAGAFFLGSISGAIGASWVGFVLSMVGFLGVPIAAGIAILKYRLYEIDILINRTLVYGSLTVMLALVYFGGVTTTQAIFRTLTGQEEQPQIAVVASTLVIAALFNPLRRRIQALVDRRFYRSKYDARKTLEAFSAKLRDETDLDALSGHLIGVIGETMQPAHISMWLQPSTDARERWKEPSG